MLELQRVSHAVDRGEREVVLQPTFEQIVIGALVQPALASVGKFVEEVGHRRAGLQSQGDVVQTSSVGSAATMPSAISHGTVFCIVVPLAMTAAWSAAHSCPRDNATPPSCCIGRRDTR